MSSMSPLRDDKEDASYDVESLFTNITIEETISCIAEESYVYKNLTPI